MTESIATKIDPSLLKPSSNSDDTQTCMDVNHLNLFYGEAQALSDISFQMKKNRVTAFIGPSGCGKSTLLRCFNRMNDLVDSVRVEGEIILDDKNIYAPDVDVTALRQRVGMVFQKPNPFPMSIFENVAYGLRLQGIKKRRLLEEKVEWALKGAALWDEVKDRLEESALGMSGGQQQRLVIARAIAIEAARVSDETAFMYMGEMIEFGETNKIFTNPVKKQTEDYITGRYG